MKCKKCGKTFKDIKAIGAHYRKSHPGSMKARKTRVSSGLTKKGDKPYRYFMDMNKSERETMAQLTYAYRNE